MILNQSEGDAGMHGFFEMLISVRSPVICAIPLAMIIKIIKMIKVSAPQKFAS